jgi:hypothetical protein
MAEATQRKASIAGSTCTQSTIRLDGCRSAMSATCPLYPQLRGPRVLKTGLSCRGRTGNHPLLWNLHNADNEGRVGWKLGYAAFLNRRRACSAPCGQQILQRPVASKIVKSPWNAPKFDYDCAW